MDAKRLELYELLKPKLDEESARALVLALPPDPETLPTKDDLAQATEMLLAQLDVRFAQIDTRFAQIDTRFAQADARFEEMMGRSDAKFGEVGERLGRLEAVLTRRMITTMGAWTILVGSTVGWLTTLLR